MKKIKKYIGIVLSFLMVIGNTTTLLYAKEKDGISIKDIEVTQEEYVKAVANNENISLSEAEKEIQQDRVQARVNPESVVTISRTVSKRINPSFTLNCTAYLDVVRDNLTSQYIEIVAVRSPYVYLSGAVSTSTMSGSVSSSHSGRNATVYFNGSIIYTLSTNVSVGVNILGISIGVGAGGNTQYQYSVSTTFGFAV